MHLGSIGLFEGPPLLTANGALRLDDVRALIETRLHLVPRLRQRPRAEFFSQAPPTWSDDPNFDIENHVRLRVVPAPGDDAQLRKTCGELLAEPLPPHRPLWELTFLTGLDDGRVVLVEKLHHAVADGLAAAELATVLLDLQPTVPHTEPPPWRPAAEPGAVGRALGDMSRLTAVLARMPGGVASVMRHPIRHGRAAVDFSRALAPLPLRLIAPRSSLNTEISHERDVHFLRADLDAIHRVATEHNATINDVVLTMVCGGLRALFEGRGELDSMKDMQVLVPVGLDRHDQRTTGNGISCYFVRVPVAEQSPAKALSIIAGETRAQKQRHEELVPNAALRLLDIVPQGVLGEATRLLRRQPFFNLIVTNVPGPPVPLFALGARMLEAYPIVPLLGNQGLGVAALSYVDALHLGVFSNPAVCPDATTFCAGVLATLHELTGHKVPSCTEDRPWAGGGTGVLNG